MMSFMLVMLISSYLMPVLRSIAVVDGAQFSQARRLLLENFILTKILTVEVTWLPTNKLTCRNRPISTGQSKISSIKLS